MSSPRRSPPPPADRAAAMRMRSVRRKDTAAEMAVRRLAHRRGLRYRVHASVPGLVRVRPDMVFVRSRVAVFIDGCFWHGCPIHGTVPISNSSWWLEKLASNVKRDKRAREVLESLGWTVLRFWEHDEPTTVVQMIEAALNSAVKLKKA